jgi:hypothetical protein
MLIDDQLVLVRRDFPGTHRLVGRNVPDQGYPHVLLGRLARSLIHQGKDFAHIVFYTLEDGGRQGFLLSRRRGRGRPWLALAAALSDQQQQCHDPNHGNLAYDAVLGSLFHNPFPPATDETSLPVTIASCAQTRNVAVRQEWREMTPAKSLRTQGTTSDESSEETPGICHSSAPLGWEPFSQQAEAARLSPAQTL